MTELMLLIDDYIHEFKQTNLYQEYIKLTKEVNEKYRDEMKRLVEMRNEFNEVVKYGSYHPDFKRVTSEYQNLRKNYYEKEDVMLQLNLEKTIQSSIDSFIKTITSKISTYIPTKNELGFISKNKGGSSCGSI